VPVAVGAAVAVVAGVVAYGLTNDDDDNATTAPSDLELDDLEPALLAEDDVGAGFSATRDTGGDDDELSFDDVDSSPGCEEAIELLDASDDDDELQIEFEGPDDAMLSHGLALIEEDEPSMRQVRDALDQCGTLSWEEGETQAEMRLAAGELDGPGDEAFELEVEVEATGGPFSVTVHGYAVYTMRRGVVSTIAAFGAIDPSTFEGEPADRDLVRGLAERADEKVRQVIDG